MDVQPGDAVSMMARKFFIWPLKDADARKFEDNGPWRMHTLSRNIQVLGEFSTGVHSAVGSKSVRDGGLNASKKSFI